jgi:hypothetical protein
MRAFAAFTLALALAVFTATAATAQGNKQIMSERMAQQDLKRNIVEAVIGYKLKSETEFGFTETSQYNVDTRAASVIKDITVDKTIYDPEKDVALCFGHIVLTDLVNVMGEKTKFNDVRVEGFGFGTMTEASRPPLRALRAALVNAQDQIATALVGDKIFSRTRTDDFILSKDSNQSKICAAVYGAYIPNPALNDPNRGWGWDESGNAFVYLEMDAHKVKDVLGNLMVYKQENIIKVIGRGAQKDETSDSGEDGQNPNLVRDPGSKTQYMDLGMPGAKQPTPQQDPTGKPAQ